MNSVINVVGDSHGSVFSTKPGLFNSVFDWQNHENFKIIHVGAFTAYNCIEKYEMKEICNSIPFNEYLLLMFGEIDCRCRVGRAIEPLQNLNIVLERYFEFINSLPNKNIILTSIVPCIVEDPMKDYFNEDNTRREEFTATRGKLEERNIYKKIFSDNCKKFCKDNNYRFVDFWNYVYLKKQYYWDDIHLHNTIVRPYIKNELEKQLK
jgi:hypothetical protein